MRILNKLFDGRNVEIQQDDNGNLWFEVESLSMAIGYITKAKVGNMYINPEYRKH